MAQIIHAEFLIKKTDVTLGAVNVIFLYLLFLNLRTCPIKLFNAIFLLNHNKLRVFAIVCQSSLV